VGWMVSMGFSVMAPPELIIHLDGI
jgi:hypothetical protein